MCDYAATMVGNTTTGVAMTAYMDHKDLANEVIEQSRAREITDGVHRVLDRIAEVESVAGREAGSVHLLAAIKTRDVGEILAAIDAGVHRKPAAGDCRQSAGTGPAAGRTWVFIGRG